MQATIHFLSFFKITLTNSHINLHEGLKINTNNVKFSIKNTPHFRNYLMKNHKHFFKQIILTKDLIQHHGRNNIFTIDFAVAPKGICKYPVLYEITDDDGSKNKPAHVGAVWILVFTI